MNVPKSIAELWHQLRTAFFGTTILDMRIGVVLTLCIYFGTILLGNYTPYNLFWYSLGVPIMGHLFADLQDVLIGMECTRRGFDVLAVDPCMPGAVMRPNYPRLWMALSSLDLGAKDTLWLGLVFGALFFLCVLWFAGRLNFSEAAVYSLALASPSIMLAIERGNIDVILFLMLALALTLLNFSTVWRGIAYSVIFLTGALKLFPIFAIIAIVRERMKTALGGIAIIGAAIIAYIAFTFNDLQRINAQVPRTVGLGYGRTVLTDVLQNSALFESILRFRLQPTQAIWLSIIMLVICLLSVYFIVALSHIVLDDLTSFALDAFRVGAAIFIGTFAIGGVADYHFIFLLFTLPQLLWWFKFESRLRLWVSAGIISLLCTLYLSRWSLTADTAFGIPSKYYLPDEILNWLLLVFYSYLLLLSLPPWVKQIIFPRKKIVA